MSNLGNSLRISASGMYAERFRMDVISANIANANSMKIKGGPDPYKRREVVLRGSESGAKITAVIENNSPFKIVKDPSNPNADKDGNVIYSNVEPVYEMVNMMSASRAYEANIAAFNSTKTMIRSALQIGKV